MSGQDHAAHSFLSPSRYSVASCTTSRAAVSWSDYLGCVGSLNTPPPYPPTGPVRGLTMFAASVLRCKTLDASWGR